MIVSTAAGRFDLIGSLELSTSGKRLSWELAMISGIKLARDTIIFGQIRKEIQEKSMKGEST